MQVAAAADTDTLCRVFGEVDTGIGGAVAEITGPPLAVGLAGLTGLTAASILAMRWVHLRGRAIQAQHGS